MMMTKEQLFQAALALNGADKKYQITIEGDTIVTRVKWMDATFFSPNAVTNEMQSFEYRVRVFDNGKYRELDKSVSVSKSAGPGGFGVNKSVFVGKQISFDKTVGIGQDHQTGEVGVINNTFYSEEYKYPVRNLLQANGCKKKMSGLTKGLIFGGIGVVVVLIAVAVLLLFATSNKTPVSVADFEAKAASCGYQVGIDTRLENQYDYVNAVRIAMDTKDKYQIEYYALSDTEHAKGVYLNNEATLKEIAKTESNQVSGSVTGLKYDKYEASTANSFLYVARIDNTVVYVNVGIVHKAEVQEFLNAIGY